MNFRLPSIVLAGLLLQPVLLSGSADAQESILDYHQIMDLRSVVMSDSVADGQRLDSMTALKRAADAGHDSAMVALGDIYRNEGPLGDDLNRALDYYESALEKGNIEAPARLGNLFLRRSSELNQDPLKAIEFFQTGANAGDPASLAGLGDVYREGSIAERDLEKAEEFYEKAAELGSTYAMGRLGNLYLRHSADLGAQPEDALHYLTMGAEANDGNALTGLGDVYSEGKLKPRDLSKAKEFYEAASEFGGYNAPLKLAKLYYREYSALGVDRNTSLDLAEAAASDGHPGALHLLGDIFKEGAIVKQDIARSIRYYKLANEGGDPTGAVSAAKLLLRGTAEEKAEGTELLKVALETDAPGAKILEAETYLYGLSRKQDVATGVRILRDEYDTGGLSAGLRLLQLNEQGLGELYDKSETRSKELLAELREEIPAAQYRLEEVVFNGAFARDRESLRDFTNDVKNLTPGARAGVASRIFWLNKNAFVYLVQAALIDREIASMRPDGLLTTKTLQLFHRVCMAENSYSVCSRGPLSDGFRDFLVAVVGEW